MRAYFCLGLVIVKEKGVFGKPKKEKNEKILSIRNWQYNLVIAGVQKIRGGGNAIWSKSKQK